MKCSGLLGVLCILRIQDIGVGNVLILHKCLRIPNLYIYTAIKVRFLTLLCLRKCVGNTTLQSKFQEVYMKFGSIMYI